jgi:hypothetical protein
MLHPVVEVMSAAALVPQSTSTSSLVSDVIDAHDQRQQSIPSLTSTSVAGLSLTMPLRTPSMEEDEHMMEDMEMADEDELLFLNTDNTKKRWRRDELGPPARMVASASMPTRPHFLVGIGAGCSGDSGTTL